MCIRDSSNPPLSLPMCLAAVQPPAQGKGSFEDAFGLDPTSDEFQAVKRELERLSRDHSAQVNSLVRQGGTERTREYRITRF